MDDELKALLAQLLVKVEVIDSKVDALAKDVEGVKHASAVQHYKVVGRVEQVASMLAEHMVDHHPSVIERKTG
jgi:hypothetical protein